MENNIRLCSVEGCNRKYYCKGYCGKHYTRYRKSGDPLIYRKRTTSEMHMTKHPLYGTYNSMIGRCYTPTNKMYDNYGGRGIKVCDRWVGDCAFINFLLDMGERPSPKHSLDRINNNGNYSPENCRWATSKEQANNKRSNILLTFNGKTQNMTQWAEELGITLSMIYYRINAGWEIEAILTKPSQRANSTSKHP